MGGAQRTDVPQGPLQKSAVLLHVLRTRTRRLPGLLWAYEVEQARGRVRPQGSGDDAVHPVAAFEVPAYFEPVVSSVDRSHAAGVEEPQVQGVLVVVEDVSV